MSTGSLGTSDSAYAKKEGFSHYVLELLSWGRRQWGRTEKGGKQLCLLWVAVSDSVSVSFPGLLL